MAYVMRPFPETLYFFRLLMSNSHFFPFFFFFLPSLAHFIYVIWSFCIDFYTHFNAMGNSDNMTDSSKNKKPATVQCEG